MKERALHTIDLYKSNHILFYGPEITYLYENYTPRSAKYSHKAEGTDDKIVLFGLQYFLKYWLGTVWKETFFDVPKEKVVNEYKRRMKGCLGEGNFPYKHIEDLHDLGYLPIYIKALPEGTAVDAGIPYFTLINTLPEFAWVPGFLEDTISNLIWKTSTSATISRKYKQIAKRYADETTDDSSYIDFFFHDFQLRGTGGVQDAVMSGMGHLLSFVGSDNVPAIDGLEDWYNANSDNELIGVGVIANEHSCVCSGGQENEFSNYEKWITKTFPKGIRSFVSDTWNLWNVITNYLPKLKPYIIVQDGKVVIRPDSSPKTPLEIICGDEDAPEGSPERKGVVQLLWEIFGGQTNTKGYKELDSHIGMIYGEAIQLQLLPKIYEALKKKGFAANCCVFGLGSGAFMYGVTRDNYSWACKATACINNGQFREIFKDPVTDSGSKKSAKGLLRVDKIDNKFILKDGCSWDEEGGGELIPVFKDGKLLQDWSLSQIRERLETYL